MAKKLLISVVALVVTLLLAEGGHRVWLMVQGKSYSVEEQIAGLDKVLEYTAGDFGGREQQGQSAVPQVPHPFLGFEDARGAARLAKALKRMRSATDDTYWVLVLGGSVAAGFGNHGAEVLTETIGQDPRLEGRKVEVLNYGVAAFKQPQQVNLLSYLLSLGCRFDAVVLLDGFNEVSVSNANFDNKVHPVYPSSRKWLMVSSDWQNDRENLRIAGELAALKVRLKNMAEAAKGSPALHSSILTTLSRARMVRMGNQAAALENEFISRIQAHKAGPSQMGPAFPGKAADAIRESVRNWYECSLSMSAMCKIRGMAFLHALQPSWHDPGSKPKSQKEIDEIVTSDAWLEAIDLGYPQLREAKTRLADNGVH